MRYGEELSEDELDAVSGGGNKWPKTKEEADHVISTVKCFLKVASPEYARDYLKIEGYSHIKLDVLCRGEGVDKLRDVFYTHIEREAARG